MIFSPKYRFSTPFAKLELSYAIRNFGLGLITLFVPIYLLEKGFVFNQVVLYYCTYLLAFIFFTAVIGFVSRIIKFKWLMMAHYPLYFISYLSLYLFANSFANLLIIAAITGISSALFWLGHHLMFRMFSSHNHRGLNVGIDRNSKELTKSSATMLGGLIIGLFNPGSLFLVSGIIFISASIPLCFVPHINTSFEPRYLMRIGDRVDGQIMKFWFTHGLIDIVVSFTWPIFIYLTIAKQYEIIGLLSGISLVALLIENLTTGELYDRGKRVFIRIGALATSILYTLMFFAGSLLHAVGINLFKSFVIDMYTVPMIAQMYNDSEKTEHLMDFFIKQELVINCTKLLSVAILLLLPDIKYVFVISALILFLLIVIEYKAPKDILIK